MKKFIGRALVIKDSNNELINDIDTDQIYHNSHLAVTDIKEMGRYALGNLDGWENFAEEARKGDILIVGENFGCGSSRQQAVDCFISLGTSCILAKSYGAIYKRNAINSGFPIFRVEEINLNVVETGDEIEVDADECSILKENKLIGRIAPMSKVQREIYKARNIFLYAKEMKV
jgi:3-isopropylmalate/(R)-2-methylmalate dehydratase small subunit